LPVSGLFVSFLFFRLLSLPFNPAIEGLTKLWNTAAVVFNALQAAGFCESWPLHAFWYIIKLNSHIKKPKHEVSAETLDNTFILSNAKCIAMHKIIMVEVKLGL